MPETLRLDDLHLEQALTKHIDREMTLGRFALSHGRTLVIDGHSGEPGSSQLVSDLKAKLGRYIDFENGGLRMLELDVRGAPARFTLVPGWTSAPENGARGAGGPSITLKFTITW